MPISRKYSLIDEIKNNPLYHKRDRDIKARQILEDLEAKHKSTKKEIFPGQLVLFKYLNPITEEDLQYWDASPLTIFFGILTTAEGNRRVVGLNIHYLPPAIRYQVLNRIFEMFRPVYSKYFETGLGRDLDGFDYQYLTEELSRYNLRFTVRMYDPALISGLCVIRPGDWKTAVFTEGRFRKETRAAILAHFKQDSASRKKIHTSRGLTYKRKS